MSASLCSPLLDPSILVATTTYLPELPGKPSQAYKPCPGPFAQKRFNHMEKQLASKCSTNQVHRYGLGAASRFTIRTPYLLPPIPASKTIVSHQSTYVYAHSSTTRPQQEPRASKRLPDSNLLKRPGDGLALHKSQHQVTR